MRKTLPIPVVALVVLSACGGAATDVEDLSNAQIRTELIEVLNSTHAFDLDYGNTSGLWPCPTSGGVQNLRAYHYEESPTVFVLDGYLKYQSCEEFSTEGQNFSLSGDMTTSLSYELDAFGRITNVDGVSSGEISWRARGQTGSCVLDLSVVPVDESVHVTGSACGGTVDRTYPWLPTAAPAAFRAAIVDPSRP